jgi:transposase
MPTTKSSPPPAPEGAAATVRPKRYDEAFKRQAVENWLRSGRPGTQIARELGVSYPALKDWKRRYYGDATPVRADLEAENRALKAELQRVREQRDILKKTLGILSETPKSATNASKS